MYPFHSDQSLCGGMNIKCVANAMIDIAGVELPPEFLNNETFGSLEIHNFHQCNDA